MRHLLVTNDFPPKVGGIQTYLWELWRRLPADDVTVLTTAVPDSAAFDAAQPFRIERIPQRVMLPVPSLARRIDRLAAEVDADLVMLDPALPLGPVGRHLRVPYGLVMHGSELLGRLPGGSQQMGRVVRGARVVIAAGGYPASEARRVGGDRTPAVIDIPPGIDTLRFAPLDAHGRAAARDRFGLPADAPVVLGLSRLVPRKGFDTLIDACTLLAAEHPTLTLAIAGSGREGGRLAAKAAASSVEVVMLGRVAEADLPGLYGAADVFAMLCHDRWLGLETEGFGIVFLEAASCGVPQVAGASGGAADAVADGVTGLVVHDPRSPKAAAGAIGALLANPALRASMAAASRTRAVESFDYDVLARQLLKALGEAGDG